MDVVIFRNQDSNECPRREQERTHVVWNKTVSIRCTMDHTTNHYKITFNPTTETQLWSHRVQREMTEKTSRRRRRN